MSPATNITGKEARSYVGYFGKRKARLGTTVRRPSPFITRLGRETAEEAYAGSRN